MTTTALLNATAPLDVQLRAEWIVGVGYRYDVLLDGEVIVRRSRDPEFDTARVLHARGLRGRFRTIDFRTGMHRMTLDIEKAARLRVVERDKGGLAVEPYRPLSEEVGAVLSPHTCCQGRVSPTEVQTNTGEPVKRAGGETCVALALPLVENDQSLLPEEA